MTDSFMTSAETRWREEDEYNRKRQEAELGRQREQFMMKREIKREPVPLEGDIAIFLKGKWVPIALKDVKKEYNKVYI